MLGYEFDLTLKYYLRKQSFVETYFARTVLNGLYDGIVYLHSKGLLHNQISSENICLLNTCRYYEPILVGFSCSCRAANAKK